MKRALDKENAEEREAARRTFSRAVQALASQARARDPRLARWKEQLGRKAKDNERKAAAMAQRAWERSRQGAAVATDNGAGFGGISLQELEDKLASLEVDHGKVSHARIAPLSLSLSHVAVAAPSSLSVSPVVGGRARGRARAAPLHRLQQALQVGRRVRQSRAVAQPREEPGAAPPADDAGER